MAFGAPPSLVIYVGLRVEVLARVDLAAAAKVDDDGVRPVSGPGPGDRCRVKCALNVLLPVPVVCVFTVFPFPGHHLAVDQVAVLDKFRPGLDVIILAVRYLIGELVCLALPGRSGAVLKWFRVLLKLAG